MAICCRFCFQAVPKNKVILELSYQIILFNWCFYFSPTEQFTISFLTMACMSSDNCYYCQGMTRNNFEASLKVEV